jgi:hypothetical protein
VSPGGPVADVEIDALIQQLAPLNNAYRAAVKSGRASGHEVLEIMWDAGEVLRRAGVRKPDPIAWAIYGRPGEPRHSYITRDFTCSCFRVRKYFHQRSDINGEFPGLKKHNLFKLALPLLDNEKYALKGAKREALIALLNGAEPPSRIKREIVAMKRDSIAPRLAKARSPRDLNVAAGQVIARHAELVEINATKNRRRLRALRKRIGDENLLLLSRLCLALFSEEFTAPVLVDDAEIPGLWHGFYLALAPVAIGGPAARNRLRRRTGRIVFVEMAEMLSAARNGGFPGEAGIG